MTDRARSTVAAAVLPVLAVLGAAACSAPVATGATGRTAVASDASAPADRLVLVSGRDDHGMVAAERVPLYTRVEGRTRAGTVTDGTYARVLATDGQWLHVRTVEGRRVTGWIDDFFLRGTSRLVGPVPSCTVRLAGRREPGGTPVVVRAVRGHRARVETVAEAGASAVATGWVPRGALQELPPQGARCGDIPPDDRHAHDE